MIWLPVVERELRVAARRRSTYRIRFWAALIMVGLFAFAMLENSATRAASSQVGRELLPPLSLLAFFFSISVGVVATSDSVSEEKRGGTLGLLFLTDLKGHDVILGKLAAHSINALYALVAIMPVLGMPLLFGGVTAEEFVKLLVALVSAIVLSLATGIFVSTFSISERKSMFFTFIFLAAMTFVPFLEMMMQNGAGMQQKYYWCVLMFSPAFAVGMAMDPPPFWPAESYWYGIGWSWLLAIGLLLIASAKAPRSWTERAPKPARERKFFWRRRFDLKGKPKRKWLEQNPFYWLAMRGEASQGRVWFFVLSMFAMWFLAWARFRSVMWTTDAAIPIVLILNMVLKIWVVGEASRRFIEDRQNNAMEFLLSTPLDELQILWGQMRALVRQFVGPVVAVVAWEILLDWALGHNWARENWWGNHDETARVASEIVFLPIDALTLAWAGMWLGMVSRSRAKVMVVSLVTILVAPWALSQLSLALAENIHWLDGLNAETKSALSLGLLDGIGLLIDVAVVLWCVGRLITGFRRLALSTT